MRMPVRVAADDRYPSSTGPALSAPAGRIDHWLVCGWNARVSPVEPDLHEDAIQPSDKPAAWHTLRNRNVTAALGRLVTSAKRF